MGSRFARGFIVLAALAAVGLGVHAVATCESVSDDGPRAREAVRWFFDRSTDPDGIRSWNMLHPSVKARMSLTQFRVVRDREAALFSPAPSRVDARGRPEHAAADAWEDLWSWDVTSTVRVNGAPSVVTVNVVRIGGMVEITDGRILSLMTADNDLTVRDVRVEGRSIFGP